MPAAQKSRATPNLRWQIIALIFSITCINYIDRTSIGLLFTRFGPELHISAAQYSRVGATLLLAYTVSQAVSGRLYDRLGSRLGFTLSVILWCVAAMAHAAIAGFASLALCSFFLGLGEAGNWPGAAKVIGEWFPARERALAMAIFNGGASMGGVLGPLLIAGWLEPRLGWRWTFVVIGSLGFLWLIAWLRIYRPLTDHPHVTAEERSLILAGHQQPHHLQTENSRPEGAGLQPRHSTQEKQAPLAARATPHPAKDASFVGAGLQPRHSAPQKEGALAPEAIPLAHLLRLRATWSILLARFFVDPVWWLYMLWLPSYLAAVHHLNLHEIGIFAWAPYVCAALGSLFGGWLSGRLIRAGRTVNYARKLAIVLAAGMMPCGILAARAHSPATALALIAIVLFGFQMWISNVQTLPSDYFPASSIATVAGLGGMAAGFSSLFFNLCTGWLVTHFGYASVLTIAGVLAPIGLALLLLVGGTIRRIPTPHLKETA